MKHGADWYKREPRSMIDAKRAAKMTPLQACIYDLVIDLIYEGAGETPNDPQYFAAHFRGVTEAEAAQAVSDLCAMPRKLVVVGDCLTNQRAKIQAKTKEGLSTIRSKAGSEGGKKSAEARRNKRLQANGSNLLAAEEIRGEEIRKESVGPNGPMSARQGDADLLGDSPPPDVSRGTIQDAYDAFVAMAKTIPGFPVPSELNEKRRRSIGARLEAHGVEGWQKALDKIPASPFLRGETGRDSWGGADLDWLIRPSNFPKVIEGKYDGNGDRKNGHGHNGKAPGMVDDFRAASAIAARIDAERAGRLDGRGLRSQGGGEGAEEGDGLDDALAAADAG